jgi:hypothetical protein
MESLRKDNSELYDKIKDQSKEGVLKLKNEIHAEFNALQKQLDGLDSFRHRAMAFVEDISAIATDAMGIPRGSWEKPTGTVGPKSDIDSPYKAAKGVSEEDQMLAKVVVDTAWTHMFRDLSGTQVDLERYLVHPSRTRNLTNKLHTPEARQQNAFLDLKMSALARCRVYFGKAPEKWDAYKKNQIELHPDQKEALEAMFKDVEAFEKRIQEGVDKQAKLDKEEHLAGLKPPISDKDIQISPADKKRAAMSYKTSRLLAMSEEMTKLEGELDKQKQELAKISLRTFPNREQLLKIQKNAMNWS